MDLAAERERWILWLPVAFGAGIGFYFTLPSEPPRWLGPWILLSLFVLGFAFRRSALAFVTALALGTAALGFTLAVERTHRVAHPVPARSLGIVGLGGRVVDVEPSGKGFRLVLDHVRLHPVGDDDRAVLPDRVRVKVSAPGDPPRPGQRVVLRAGLGPPPPPSAPGAYDFQRAAWFQELGAVGFAVGFPEVVASPEEEGGFETLRLAVTRARLALTARIEGAVAGAGLSPGVGATAAALVTAERGGIPPAVLDAFRDAGLAHILVISGMHMSMVAGLVFFGLRAILAAIPALALRFSIKKWAAAAALAVTAGYLVVSGAPVPTQRAFVMNAVVLLAVLLDREALSLRSIGWAAMAVLALHPEALIGPSFQMSFAAVYGLIGAYEVMGPKLAAWRRRHPGRLGGVSIYLLGILLTTQVAGTATAFYTIYHFDRYATYSLLGNLLAVPVVGFWVMPAALLAFCLMPLGLDGWGWALMGEGIGLVEVIGVWVSSLPGATVDLPAIPAGALVVFTLGGFWLVLWRRRWRLFGLCGIAAGLLMWAGTSPPDLLIDSSGKLAAFRGEDGTLSFSGRVSARRSRLAWARLAGQGTESPKWSEEGAAAPACDSLGCVRRVDGRALAFVKRPEALSDDCRHADLVVVPTPFRDVCPSARLVIDGFALRARGTHAVWIEPGGYRVETVADWQGDRPWSLSARMRTAGNRGMIPQQAPVDAGLSSGAADPPDGPEP